MPRPPLDAFMYKMAGVAHLAKPAHFLRNGVAMVSRFRSTQVMGKVTIINSHVSREHTPTEYTFSFYFLRRCVKSSDVIRWLSFCVMERRYSVLSNESEIGRPKNLKEAPSIDRLRIDVILSGHEDRKWSRRVFEV